MFLQRLRQLLSQVFSRFTGRLHLPPSKSTNPLENESQTATPVEYRQSTDAGVPASGLASGRWLDDTRRMRPRLTATRSWATYDRPSQAARLIRPDSLPVSSPRPPDRSAGPDNPAYEPASTAPQPELRELQPAEGVDQQGKPASHRQLMALKYLVRLGIYNEGFASGSMPDQYQHSLGMDEPDNGFLRSDSPNSPENTPG
ncbi:MAG: hypothetical protein ACLQUY_25425 [Ktedonobacterales bacterium]